MHTESKADAAIRAAGLTRRFGGVVAVDHLDLEVAYGEPHYRALFMLGVVLFLITFALNTVADFVLNRQARRAQA